MDRQNSIPAESPFKFAPWNFILEKLSLYCALNYTYDVCQFKRYFKLSEKSHIMASDTVYMYYRASLWKVFGSSHWYQPKTQFFLQPAD